ncbi:MAG: HD domain-containing protein [Oscillibacter sp.]|nr:HD domain-containing protein [Oscillibacter sp.]
MNRGALAVEAMIARSGANLPDVNHFLKVYALAETIGRLEGLEPDMQETLEVAAAVHDIACPLCREKYGSTDGKLQEIESPPLVRELLHELGFGPALIRRVCALVARHHTYADVDGPDCQILLEADFLVNAGENRLPGSVIAHMERTVFRTPSGLRLLRQLYPCETL